MTTELDENAGEIKCREILNKNKFNFCNEILIDNVKKKILIVDDDHFNIFAAKEILLSRYNNIECTWALNGEEAI